MDYEERLAEAIFQVKRVVRPGGSIFWQTGYTQPGDGHDILPIDIISYRYFKEQPITMHLWDRIIWRYWGGHAFQRKFTNKHETLLWFVKPGADPSFDVDSVRERSKEYDKRNNLWGRNPGNVWEVDRVASGSTEQTSHIAVFPEELSERIIRSCSAEGHLVLDPFSGSGTVPKVARSLGRRWIGIEISSTYASESAYRVGFQQPSEASALGSELLKTVAFYDKEGVLGIEDAARRLLTWVRSVKLQPIVDEFDQDIAAAIADRTGAKTSKRRAWIDYDRRIEGSPDKDVVVLVDGLLLRSYKNRRNLNGVSRYKSALELLDTVRWQIQDTVDSAEKYVRRIVEEEPSSYEANDGLITLKTTKRRIPPQHTTHTVSNTGTTQSSDLETGADVLQGRLPV